MSTEPSAAMGRSAFLASSFLVLACLAGPLAGTALAVTEPPWRIDRMNQPRPLPSGGDQRLRTEIAELRAALSDREGESQALVAQIDRSLAAANHRFAAAIEDADAASASILARFELFAAALIAIIAALCAWIIRLQRQVITLARQHARRWPILPRIVAARLAQLGAPAESSGDPATCRPVQAARLPRGGPTTRPPAARRVTGSG